MTPLPWARPAPSFLDSHQLAVCRAWRAAGSFGLLLVGDAWLRERLLDHLAHPGSVVIPAAATESDLTVDTDMRGAAVPSTLHRARRRGAVVPCADLIDPAVAAILDVDYILASAGNLDSVPPTLLSRLPVVLGLRVRPVMRSRRPPRQGTTEDWVIASLDANALADHRLDIGAVRAVRAVESAGGSASTTLCRNVIEPRLAPMMDAAVVRPTPTAGPAAAAPAGDGTPGELEHDEADIARAPSAVPETATPPEWVSSGSARRYAQRRHPGRRGALARTRRGRSRRAVDFDPLLGLDVHRTLVAAHRRGRLDRFALRSSIRVRRAGRLTIVIVDRSDSMSSTLGRAVASIAVGAIEESSRNRSAVAVISARGASADLVVEPTRDVADAHAVISRLPSGGGTPLASAFLLAAGLVSEDPDRSTRVVVLSDGGTNVRLEPELGADGTARAQTEIALRALVAVTDQVVLIPTVPSGRRIRGEDLQWCRDCGAVVRDT